MLTNKIAYPTLPAVDLNRAKMFYQEKLGLKLISEDPNMGITFKTGQNCMLFLYPRSSTKADHTVLTFDVDDLDAEVRDLRSKGIRFEEYDIPSMGIKTVNGISTFSDQSKMAWFKDSEGNILAVGQLSKVTKDKMMRQMAGATTM